MILRAPPTSASMFWFYYRLVAQDHSVMVVMLLKVCKQRKGVTSAGINHSKHPLQLEGTLRKILSDKLKIDAQSTKDTSPAHFK